MSLALLTLGLAIAALVLVLVELVREHRELLAWAVLLVAAVEILDRL